MWRRELQTNTTISVMQNPTVCTYQGLKLLQTSKKRPVTVISTRRDDWPVNMRKAFRKLNDEIDTVDDDDRDEIADLEEKIK